MKSKGERERYIHLNAVFQRIARRDEKTFLSDQCKEIEGKDLNGKEIYSTVKTRDLFTKNRGTGTISCKDGKNKGQKRDGPKRSKRY